MSHRKFFFKRKVVLIIQFENLQNIKLFFIEFSNTVLPKQLPTPIPKGGNLMLQLSPLN